MEFYQTFNNMVGNSAHNNANLKCIPENFGYLLKNLDKSVTLQRLLKNAAVLFKKNDQTNQNASKMVENVVAQTPNSKILNNTIPQNDLKIACQDLSGNLFFPSLSRIKKKVKKIKEKTKAMNGLEVMEKS